MFHLFLLLISMTSIPEAYSWICAGAQFQLQSRTTLAPTVTLPTILKISGFKQRDAGHTQELYHAVLASVSCCLNFYNFLTRATEQVENLHIVYARYMQNFHKWCPIRSIFTSYKLVINVHMRAWPVDRMMIEMPVARKLSAAHNAARSTDGAEK